MMMGRMWNSCVQNQIKWWKLCNSTHPLPFFCKNFFSLQDWENFHHFHLFIYWCFLSDPPSFLIISIYDCLLDCIVKWWELSYIWCLAIFFIFILFIGTEPLSVSLLCLVFRYLWIDVEFWDLNLQNQRSLINLTLTSSTTYTLLLIGIFFKFLKFQK